MQTLNDAIRAATGGPTVNDGLRAWYIAGGAVGTTLNDLERSWLSIRTANTGTLADMWMAFLGASGYTGTLNDRLRAYWAAQLAPPPLGPNEHNLTVGNGGSAVGFLDGAYGTINPTTIGAQTIDGVYVASTDVMYIEFVGGVQAGTSTTIEVSGPNGGVTCSWVPASLNYRSIITPGLFAAMSTEVDSIITIEIVPT